MTQNTQSAISLSRLLISVIQRELWKDRGTFHTLSDAVGDRLIAGLPRLLPVFRAKEPLCLPPVA